MLVEGQMSGWDDAVADVPQCSAQPINSGTSQGRR